MSLKGRNIRKRMVLLLRMQKQLFAGVTISHNPSVSGKDSSLPRIDIYRTKDSFSREYTTSPKQDVRIAKMFVEIKAEDPDEEKLADRLDELAELCEDIFTSDVTLSCGAEDVELTDSAFEFEGAGDMPTASCVMIFDVTYIKATPETRKFQSPNEADWTAAGFEWNVGSANDPDPEAKDDFDPQA